MTTTEQTSTEPTTDAERIAAARAAKDTEPTVEPFGRDGKGLRARWVLTRDEQGRPVEVTNLHLFHHGRPTYAYRATINRATVSYGEHGTGEMSAPMSAAVVKDVPNATRYAKAAARRALDAALAVVLNPDTPDAYLDRFRADLGGHKDR